MPNMSNEKVKMPEQKPDIRNKNFLEVSVGYTEEMALEEASRCLNCKNAPCMTGCPVNVKIPQFIDLIKNKDFEGAYKKIKETSTLPAICGRVCPQESQCEKYCVRGIKGEAVGIGRLERFAADYFMNNCEEKVIVPEPNGKKVAVIGSGPSGLTCAGDLAKLGYKVTVFEAFHKAGGVLVYGIPEFRLPKAIVEKEINKLKDLGVTIETNVVIGRTLEIKDIFEDGYDAVFIGTGAGLPSFMKIPGENLNGVYSANEFLTRINLMNAYKFPEYDTPVSVGKSVAVIGGGNVAMDAARCAKRLGADVAIAYRRTADELPARREEVHHAEEEGIEFNFLVNPIEIISDENGCVKAVRFERMVLGEPDASGRRSPVKATGEDCEFVAEADNVIMAIGTSPNPLIRSTTKGLETGRRGEIIVNGDDGLTSRKGVYAGGDAVTGAATVILAMGAGKNAAAAIDKYLNDKR